jgi:hypothetical protein
MAERAWSGVRRFSSTFPHLKERMAVAADYLSDGEQQMVAVARAEAFRIGADQVARSLGARAVHPSFRKSRITSMNIKRWWSGIGLWPAPCAL